ncbi:Putative phage integrase [Herminiimonas arsenicoxydans]|uniref:Phage integrase n=1 Tax=Herminiimonas arsenicoxydans TaxID=204773 RepID=A4G655_HERAR|nr:Putative phage integrase [Herminiimonas arsenicoxydans]
MAKMTVQQVAALKAKDKPYKRNVDNGLQLRIATNGVKTWVIQYVVNGKQREYRLSRPYGTNTDDGHLSLLDARNEAAKIRALARDGIDFQIQKEEAKVADTAKRAEADAENLTTQNLFDEWVITTDRKDKGAELRRLFARDVLPKVGTKALKSLAEKDMRGILDAVVNRGSDRMAVMLLSDLKQMFRWAEKRRPWKKLIDDNPIEHLEAKRITSADYDGAERTRTLSADEIKELADKLPDAGLLKRTEICMWIMLSCCCRIGEVIKARWEHIDLDAGIWTIPKENAKNKMAHTIYLSAFALPRFRELKQLSGKSTWCFPREDDEMHVCIKSTTKQIRDRQKPPGGKPMSNRSKKADALILTAGDWVPHDLRRTGATMMQSLGVVPDVIERCLNHVEPNKLRRTYQTYDYATEKQEAWQLLGDRLSLILNPAGNVIVLRKA